MSASKGDRVRLTARLPRWLVEALDAYRKGTDRNETLTALLALGLGTAVANESTTAPRAPISGGNDSS